MSTTEKRIGLAVAALLTRGSGAHTEVLLGKRRGGSSAGLWGTPGGKVEFGETLEGALLREVMEETGFRMRASTRFIGINETIGFRGWHYVTAYFHLSLGNIIAERTSSLIENREPESCEGWEWLSVAALPGPGEILPGIVEQLHLVRPVGLTTCMERTDR